MALILNAIEKNTSRKSGKPFYSLYCSDTYDHKRWLCGSPMKVVDCSEYVLFKALGFDVSTPEQLSFAAAHAAEFANNVVGRTLFVTYNENGYTSYIKFYEPDDKNAVQTAGNNYVPLPDEPAY